jgi:hypothetical protein
MNLFYPAHDLALAKGVRHFTPPLAAQRLAADLSELAPLWQPEAEPDLPLPWGWNYNTCKALAAAGVDTYRLPSTADLETLRALSARTTVIGILNSLRTMGLPPAACGDITLPLAIDAAADLPLVAARQTGGILLKAPWSSSGRGLSWSRVMPSEALWRRGAAIIRQMGCVLLEPEYAKVQDLAMLFYADRRGVQWVGYSMFETDAMGTYRHGLVASNEEMERRLSAWIAPEALRAVQRAYTDHILPELLAPLTDRPYPIGYVGVDMMVYRDSQGGYRLHPCVEVNLRCTMGVVARRIYDRLVTPGAVGSYRIEHAATAATLREQRAQQEAAHPQQREGERYSSGYFTLTTLTDESQFAASLLLK